MDTVKNAISTLTCIAMILAHAGCATVMGGSKQDIAVDSAPDGARVTSTLAGMAATMKYTTPTTVSFERKGHYILTFTKEGYDSKQIELTRSMRGWMLLWDVILFPVGVVVDAITGAWYRLEPEQVTVTLTKISANLPGPEQINVTVSKVYESDQLNIQSVEPVSIRIKSGE